MVARRAHYPKDACSIHARQTMRKIKLLRPIATFGATGIPVMRKAGCVVDMEAKAAVRFVADGGGVDVTPAAEATEEPKILQFPPPGQLNARNANSRTSRASGKPNDGEGPSAA